MIHLDTSISKLSSKCFTLALLLIASLSLNGQVLINEFSASNYDDFADSFGEHEDWIELYNAGSSTVDLSGYHLSDRLSNPTKFQIPAGVSIAAGDHLRIWCSKRDGLFSGVVHTSFAITQTRANESIVLADPSGTIIDSYDIGTPNQDGHSWGRTTDGGSTWSVFLSPTPNGSNTNPSPEYTPKPVMSPDPGYYTNFTTITITSPDPDVQIYFTLDGSTPDDSDNPYNTPFNITSTTVVKAVAISNDPNVPDSHMEYGTYFINDTHSMWIVSVSGGQVDNLMGGSGFLRPRGSFELFDETGTRVADAFGEFNKHGNDSWAYAQRGIDYITRDQFGDDWAVKHNIFADSISDRDRFQRLMLKAAANDNYPFSNGGAHIRDAYCHVLSQNAGMDMDERSYEPCILYVNGDYWGVYEIREKVDDNDYTDYYYGHDKFDLEFIKTWGNTWNEYGNGLPAWNTLHSFITSNDMSIQANYDMAADQLSMESLIDYIILNTHVVSQDWLNWNTAWWRGLDPTGDQHAAKWRYILWDNDATFDHYINYTGVPDTSPNADPCDNESPQIDDPEGHLELLTSLFANDDFYALYINRYADLNNTYFTCDYMVGLLDDMINRIAPEMQRHIDLWGGSMAGWQSNVDDLRNFILTRCTIIDSGIEDCYEVDGPFPLVVEIDPPLSGDVKVNTIIPTSYPYVSDYFSGIQLTLEGIPANGYVFDYWEPLNSTLNPGINDPIVGFDIGLGDTIVAHFILEDACPALTLQSASTDAICESASGTATVVPTAGNGPFGYLWDSNAGNQITQTATGLAAGTYTVTVMDNDGCDEAVTVTVTASAGDLDAISSTTGANCSASDGSATIAPNGGTQPFTYLWDANAGSQVTSTAINLQAGSYSATITDVNGCEFISSVIVEDVGMMQANAISTPSFCTANNGTATVNPISGSGPFTYQWDANANSQTSQTATDLPGGTYSATVTDANGCEDFISIDVDTDDTLLSLQSNANETSCAGNDGTATVFSLNGTAPFTYQWGPDTGNQTTQTATGLTPAEYGVIVTDANGCSNAIPITVFAGGTLTVSANSTDASCNGLSDGIAFVTNSPNYTYSWSNGATDATATGLSAGNYSVTVVWGLCETTESFTIEEPDAMNVSINAFESQCSINGSSASAIVIGGAAPLTYEWNTGDMMPAIGGLSTDTYTVTVTDANGCEQVSSTFITSEANGPVLSTTQTNISCPGDNDGAIDLTVTSGMAPFTFNWGDGIAQEDISGLGAGVYTVIVNDANNCIAVTSVVITEPSPMNLSLNSTSSDGNDGTASVNVFGGVPPFTYQWSNGQNGQVATGLPPGVYSVIVTDANGCSVTGEVEVSIFTGVEDLASLTNFNIYPVPTDGRFTIELEFNRMESIEISIVNMLGQVIEYRFDEGSNFNIPMDISQQASGIFAVQVKTDEGIAVREVIKVE
ncbi:MAG: CotH kinase family protein [Bacteroidota bacterium]